jgi:hypothetical protein
MQGTVDFDNHGLARQNVAHDLKIEGIHGHALRGHHVLDPLSRLAPAHAQGPETVWITKRHDAVADD